MTSKGVSPAPRNQRRLEDVQVPIRVKLSALWAAVMFLYVYVDIFGFFKPGTIDDILVGRVYVFDISQGWLLGAMALMTIPSLMVFLSLALPARLARWTNVIVGSSYVLVNIGGVLDETWAFYWFGSVIETALLLLLIRYAWSWPQVTAARAENPATLTTASRV